MTEMAIKQIKDMKVALKDMEPYVKNPAHLVKGREFTNFSLRPREVWANWLLCAVMREMFGESITFAESKGGDGIILDKNSGQWVMTEHVSALENPHNKLPGGEDRVITAIDHKVAKGRDYARGKKLVVFFDGAGEFYRSKIRENIKGRHGFDSIYCIGLLTAGEEGYSYSVTEFKESYGDQSITFRVDVNGDFTSWKITQIKQ